MTYTTARFVLDWQEKKVRKINNTRFIHGNYEYRIQYRGGFAMYLAIDRREIGKRNFKYFSGVGASDCVNAQQAFDKCMDEVKRMA